MFENSWVLVTIQRILNTSLLKTKMDGMYNRLRVMFINSFLMNSLRREGTLQKSYFEEAIFYRWVNFLLNYPLVMMKKICERFETFFEESYFIRGLKWTIKRYDLLLATFVCVLLITPHSYWMNTFALIMGVVFFVIYSLRAALYRHTGFQAKELGFLYFLFFLIVTLSLITSVGIGQSLRFYLFHVSVFLLVLCIVTSVQTISALRTMVFAHCIGGTLIALYALWQVVTHSVPFDPSLTDVAASFGLPGRVYSTMDNPNNFAQVLILVFPFIVAVFLADTRWWIRLAAFSGGLSVLGAILFTGSRSGWVGLLVVIFIFLLLRKPSWIPWAILTGIFMMPFLPDFVLRRALTVLNPTADSSISYRGKIYSTFLPMVKDYWFTGVGLGTDVFRQIAARYHLYTDKMPMHTHILYTQILIEMGILGLLAFLGTIMKTLKNGFVAILNTESAWISNVIAAGIAGVCGILVIGLVEYVWYYPRVLFLFWIVVAFVFAGVGIHRAKKISSNKASY